MCSCRNMVWTGRAPLCRDIIMISCTVCVIVSVLCHIAARSTLVCRTQLPQEIIAEHVKVHRFIGWDSPLNNLVFLIVPLICKQHPVETRLHPAAGYIGCCFLWWLFFPFSIIECNNYLNRVNLKLRILYIIGR